MSDSKAERWTTYTRKAMHSHTFEARPAKVGEVVGCCRAAGPGDWLCRNPENGHTWIVTKETFEMLYRLP